MDGLDSSGFTYDSRAGAGFFLIEESETVASVGLEGVGPKGFSDDVAGLVDWEGFTGNGEGEGIGREG